MNVSYKKLEEGFVLPKRGSEKAANFDCVTTSMEYLGKGVFKYGLGFATEFSEPGWKGVIVPRSSIAKTKYIMQNSPGQVDEDYRGQWFVKFRYIGIVPYHHPLFESLAPFKIGDRICQIYFEKVEMVSQTIAKELSETKRGAGGFGSTGK